MLAAALCLLAFTVTYAAARRSFFNGIVAVLVVGYLYGIVRANVLQPLSHFTFDAAVAAFFLVHLPAMWKLRHPPEIIAVRQWLLLLVGWPVLLAIVPVQDPLVQLVGFRGHTFLLPFVLVGVLLDGTHVRRLAIAFAYLNLAAFVLALAEYFLGIEPFFPASAVTEIMYRSRDVAGSTAHRIPSSFSSAHAYGGTIVATLPFLIGTWTDPGNYARWRPFLAAAIVATVLGVFMTAARQPAVTLLALGLVATASGRMQIGMRITWLAVVAVVGVIVAANERLQRFRTLQDTESVVERVQGSVNLSFFELAERYPLGNGLGGGGTSLPYFLAERVREPVYMENEFARIMLELGIAGLVIWICFLGWLVLRMLSRRSHAFHLGQRLAGTATILSIGGGLIGTGLFTSIPGTIVVLIGSGWAIRSFASSEARLPAYPPAPAPPIAVPGRG